MSLHSRIIESTSRTWSSDRGYAHWSGDHVTPGDHSKVKLVPQSMADCWEAYCSCGEWRGTATMGPFYRDDAIASLRAAHARHSAEMKLLGESDDSKKD
jgi:hypothetical protein